MVVVDLLRHVHRAWVLRGPDRRRSAVSPSLSSCGRHWAAALKLVLNGRRIGYQMNKEASPGQTRSSICLSPLEEKNSISSSDRFPLKPTGEK